MSHESQAVIRSATITDVKDLTALLNRCADHMSNRGMHHWIGVYSEASVLVNIQNKHVFILENQQQLVGCIALGTSKADYYVECWPEAPSADFYITQLAVDPGHQQKGYGQTLMKYCLQLTIGKTIQLDAVDHYPALLSFYKNFGFSIIASGVGLGDKRHLFSLT